jgi:hypothetical protein
MGGMTNSSSVGKPPAGRFDALRSDNATAFLIAVSFGLLYGVFAWRLTLGHFFEHFNLIFDYDSPAYVGIFGRWGHSDEAVADIVSRAIKHPLASWLSIFSLPFRALGARPELSAALAGASVGGLATGIFHLVARRVGAPQFDAVLLTLIFGLGAAQLFTSILVESYVYATLTILFTWYLFLFRFGAPRRLKWAAVLLPVITFGVTITNVIQSVIAELFTQLSGERPSTAIRNTLFVGLGALGLALVALAITWPSLIGYVVAHPEMAARWVYWQQTKGPKTGIGQVLLTFFGFSLAAPHFVTIALPEGLLMRDFRAFDVSWLATIGICLWIGLIGAAAYAGLVDSEKRKIAVGLLVAILFNLVLHLSVQFRGSLFIYTPHIWPVIVGLVAVGVASGQDSDARVRWAVRSALIAVLLTTAPLNLTRALEAVTLFDHPQSFTLSAKVH